MGKPPVLPLATARLGCGCGVTFRAGVEGSPITVVVLEKADACQMLLHVAGMPVFDHREALRAPTRHHHLVQPDYEEEG